MNTIGYGIATLRKKNGLTQEALAEQIGVSTQSISKWETGTNMPDVMLLPVIADVFGVTVDALYGRTAERETYSPDDVLERSCEAMLRTIAQSMVVQAQGNEQFEQQLAEYRQALKEDDRLRSAVIAKHGATYYHETLGGLLIRRPQNGWSSLLDGDDVENVFSLLGDTQLRKALAFMMKTRITVFTLPSLCAKLDFTDTRSLKDLLDRLGCCRVRTVELGDGEIDVYEMDHGAKLFILLAIAALCKEYSSYHNMYYNYCVDDTFYDDQGENV